MAQAFTLCERLREICIDWDGTPMPPGAEPRSIPSCGDIRDIADIVEEIYEALTAIATGTSRNPRETACDALAKVRGE